MATRLYARNAAFGVGATGNGELSTAMPGALESFGTSLFGSGEEIPHILSTSKGAAQTSVGTVTNASTADQVGLIAKWEVTGILSGSIAANTWTVAVCNNEGSTNANMFSCFSLYVVQSDFSTVRGYVYDSNTKLGVEYLTTQDGQVYTFAGSAVAGVLSTDYLVLELWARGTQAMGTSYNVNCYLNGATDVTGATTSDAASYLETPQDLFTAVGGSASDTIRRGTNRSFRALIVR